MIDKGKSEESLAILKRIYGDGFVEIESRRMSEQIELEKTLPSCWVPILSPSHPPEKALIGLACMFLAQGT